MKIIAEFNSNEELLSFINTFGAKTIVAGQAVVGDTKEPIAANKVEAKKDVKKENPKVESAKEDKKEKEEVEETKTGEETKESNNAEGSKEETKITKEMVRVVFSKLIKAGKQKEAKEITEKYGAKKLPDLAEEHYEAAYKDAEGLL